MTGILLRIVIIAADRAGAIYIGVRRIWRDWTKQFRAEEKAIHERDLKERDAPGVITLKRDKDGTFRPPGRKTGNLARSQPTARACALVHASSRRRSTAPGFRSAGTGWLR